jgi:hypothetical protein
LKFGKRIATAVNPQAAAQIGKVFLKLPMLA